MTVVRNAIDPAEQPALRSAPFVRSRSMDAGQGTGRLDRSRTRRLLVVAYHFPPLAGSSGIQRTLQFVRHLPAFGWEPIVLTCHPRAYERVDGSLLADLPGDLRVERTFALDAARHLSIAGRYPGWTARPDRWLTWWPAAVLRGRALIRRLNVDAIFSTYPIATAHVIGHSLSKQTRVPWIADFRDPMAQDGYPPDPRTWASFKAVEARVFNRAAACTFTTAGAAQMYRERYPHTRASICVIENGYDEQAFARANVTEAEGGLNAEIPTLLHSGIVYPEERDPSQLFVAMAMLKSAGIDGSRLRIRFRAPVHESMLTSLALEHHVEDMVQVLPHLPYSQALREMLRADGLLVLQAANCNAQVPAKLYEYLRARRCIVALTDPRGDTARTLADAGISRSASLGDAQAIAVLLRRFLAGEREGFVAREPAIRSASRLERARALAAVLDTTTAAYA